jgi:hypothetical protein
MYEKKINERKDSGPWLLTEETLIKIDSLMEKAYGDLIKWENRSDENYRSEIHTKTLTIWFKNKAEVKFQSFKEAFISEDFSNQNPFKFEFNIEVGINKINIELNSGWFNNYFQYFINCNNNIEDNIIYEMYKIYSIEKPKKLPTLTNKISFWSFLIYLLMYIILSNVIVSRYNTSYEKMIRNYVYQILSKENLQQEDYLEIIKYTTIKNYKFYDLIEGSDALNVSNLIIKSITYYLIIGFLLCTIISLNPRASFAIGKGINKVKFWKSYYKFIYHAIPIMIILPIIINIISNIITKSIN